MRLPDFPEPVVQAPMAGGPSTPALTAAVSSAGGLGFLAAGYKTAAAVRQEVQEVRSRTGAPFGVNLFVPSGGPPASEADLERYAAQLAVEAERYRVQLGTPLSGDDDWSAKLAVVAEERVPVVSFTFGCPSEQVVDTLHRARCAVAVTVTSPDEARLATDAGADALVVQGAEAGAHQGSFVDDDDERFGLLVLLRLVARTTALPLIATGGVVDGPGVAAVLVAGARAAQLGTAFLRCPEAGTGQVHRAALTGTRRTTVTRAFTGRSARALTNRFVLEHGPGAPAAYPQVHHLTSPLRAAARRQHDPEGSNLWAGQGYRLTEEVPAADLVRSLAADARAALQALR